ncbi:MULTISPECIES: M20/M25/M40 family metallo-hydrolase [unclassified Sphingopyxis]|uniref:M20/M25/M40 family metallo-hydrolase n=1 Tax=unclassified Sphingopyxis TaxID=2614943 RepID=UPI00072FE733|nr:MULTISPECIES: M20/M25/M40 family metallo-hydrolase [unclassified Sphingopyxis]KTE25714.1 peptidase M20 [Sphingopyxis sp. H057]KTE51395.1 peptidase M20 [Sphingopyxis sp. H073]KTE54107.1 peptidase M20 [Sphingopyxis sp. H071]KTE57187.1 peptidase M20 [Sphingopyxis sp. H107]KTE61767.1 peptidase M20 [Sphingopyxis sp. H100]
MKTLTALLTSMLLVAAPAAAKEAPPRPDQIAFRDIYKELVETNTTLSSGSCTLAAQRMLKRFQAAEFPGDQLILFMEEGHREEGGLAVVYPGTNPKAKAILLVAHIDVVEAKREDWERDPFTLIEEDGYFYGRGTLDDKAQAAVWVDTLLRFKKEGYKPKRTVKLALTCGEETNGAFNGVEWLAANKRDLIDAEFALNEGGGGDSDGKGKVLGQSVQVGEKTFANFRLETRNPGGHSSVPVRDNAIYQLARALTKIDEHEFPVEMTDTTRRFFTEAGAARGDAIGAAMVALAKNPADKTAEAVVNTDRFLHGNIRTTCVATLLDGGHAPNALPQRAGANVNCRIFPGHSIESIRDELMRVIGDPGVTITQLPPKRPTPPQPPLDPKIIGPMEKLVAKYWPGLKVIPSMANGYTDATFLGAAGIPTYGIPGIWGDPDGNGVHGLNERIEVKSLYVGRDFMFDLVKAYASKP